MIDSRKKELRAGKLKVTVQRLQAINTIPLIKGKVMKVLNREFSSLKDLEVVLRHDPSLTHSVVSFSNSSRYCQSNKRTDLSQALMALGFNTVKSVLNEVPVFPADAVSPYLIRLWSHSLEVAEACSEIASRAVGVSKDDAFLAGLLHDIGRIVLYQLFREFYWASTADITTSSELLEKEEEVFGGEHSRVGGWFLQGGLIPERIAIAVENHHSPLKAAKYRELAATVYYAEYLVAANADPSMGAEGGSDTDLKKIYEMLQLKEIDMVPLMVGVLTRREKITEFYEGE